VPNRKQFGVGIFPQPFFVASKCSKMSADKKSGGGFNPAKPPLFTIEQMQEMIVFFKRVFEDSPLAWWIRLAGIGAALEGLHIVWWAIRYLAKF
jgi:hypothetical protein